MKEDQSQTWVAHNWHNRRAASVSLLMTGVVLLFLPLVIQSSAGHVIITASMVLVGASPLVALWMRNWEWLPVSFAAPLVVAESVFPVNTVASTVMAFGGWLLLTTGISYLAFRLARGYLQTRLSVIVAGATLVLLWPITVSPVADQWGLWSFGALRPILASAVVSASLITLMMKLDGLATWVIAGVGVSWFGLDSWHTPGVSLRDVVEQDPRVAVCLILFAGLTQALSWVPAAEALRPTLARTRSRRFVFKAASLGATVTMVNLAQFIVASGAYSSGMRHFYASLSLLVGGLFAWVVVGMLQASSNEVEATAHTTRMLREDGARKDAKQAELERQALTDPLTGLANRAAMQHKLNSLSKSGTPAMVVLIDLDDFKSVNDNLGHGAGDALLKTVADRIRNLCRVNDCAVRLGGDEFAVVLPRRDERTAQLIANRLLEAVASPYSIEHHTCRVGASVGVAPLGVGGDFTSTMGAADAAMYEAKKAGKNRVVVANQD